MALTLITRKSRKALLDLSMRLLEHKNSSLSSRKRYLTHFNFQILFVLVWFVFWLVIESATGFQPLSSLFAGLYKVGSRNCKFASKSKRLLSFEGNTTNFRRFGSNVALKGKEEDFKEEETKLENKRKKLKGKRAVIKWIKQFRWTKKKEYERMSPQQKIEYKLKKARRKEARLIAALHKLEPKESLDPTHDPEILTPEEHFFYLKMGHKCKNYVPVGRRGIFGGVILNMHLHWKKHQTVKVIVKTFTPDEVREIAADLAKLTGGIVLDIYEGNTIIMYRGKNYYQPPSEIMTPRITLSKNKALTKSKYREALRAVRIFIPRLEKELELLCQPVNDGTDVRGGVAEGGYPSNMNISKHNDAAAAGHDKEIEEHSEDREAETEHVSDTDFDMDSDSEKLSDLFETDSEITSGSDTSGELDHALYVDNLDTVPEKNKKALANFVKDHSKMPEDSKKVDGSIDESSIPELDEVDKLFLRASSLLKKRK